ncbi:hypothetical protein GF420_02820 [candidate division GN15 bacterium]|nr:hypothetical protein [candidate division GN15 bacterium]
MTFHFLTQARLGSSRFPAKVLEPLDGHTTLIEQVIERIRLSAVGRTSALTVLTTTNPTDDRLVRFLQARNIGVARGDENDVYNRFHSFLMRQSQMADYVVRVCSDNPFIEPSFIDHLAGYLSGCDRAELPDYLSYGNEAGQPAILTHWGFFVEFVRTQAFLDAAGYLSTAAQREHVTPVFYSNPRFHACLLPMPTDLPEREYRFTIDTPQDLSTASSILRSLKARDFTYRDVCERAATDNALIGAMVHGIAQNTKEA